MLEVAPHNPHTPLLPRHPDLRMSAVFYHKQPRAIHNSVGLNALVSIRTVGGHRTIRLGVVTVPLMVLPAP